MILRSFALLSIVLGLLGLPVYADNTQVSSREEAMALVASLNYQQGTIQLENGLATIQMPDSFRFLNGDDAQKVLVRLWGNPPGEKPLGLLIPTGMSPLDSNCWVVSLMYEESGHVNDDEAEKIDYTRLLGEMQKGTRDANAERAREGYPTMELLGWAATPHYDKAAHKMHWAKEIRFADSQENTLNYNIRILGRRGVLVLNAIASMEQLPEIERTTPAILSMVDFNPGHQYADFNAATDKAAEYGVAALVAGGVASKMGFFKMAWAFILGAKKFLIIGAIALASGISRLFRRKAE